GRRCCVEIRPPSSGRGAAWESAHLAGRRCRVGIGPCSPGAAGMGITPCLPGADFEYALWICPYISRHLLSLNAQNFSIPKLTPT
ncbi:hypothetical protein ACQSND_004445, partial [Salmonella enterica]